MSYIDAYFDRERDQINIVERVNGERRFVDYPARYVFYYDDPKGKHRSIHGDPVSRFSTKQNKEFKRELAMHKGKRTYESDVNPIFRCLEENYLGKDAPKMNCLFLDIEVDFDPDRGYATPADPFMPITAISIYLNWTEQLITLALAPKGQQALAEEVGKKFDNCFIFTDEAELLDTFLTLLDDADIISGWNSEGYDIPYIVNRIAKVLSKQDTKRMCLWNINPRKRQFERFGKEEVTFDIIGRVHLDYMQLYRKYMYEERHSYALDYIAEMEVGERKTEYEGSLDELYNKDFERFIEYNRQDTALLDKIDKKLKFIDLASELAHANTVLLQTTMGAVAVTEQAILNETHRRGMVVPDRVRREPGSEPAAGAYVATPKKGMHDWIGSIDLNSLYPSVIRALNMAPETIIGQLRPTETDAMISERMRRKMSFAGAWEGEFGTLEYQAVMEKDRAKTITVDWENGEEQVMSAAEVYEMIYNSNSKWGLSANGTIFTFEVEGIIPGLLERWYAERKEMQAKMRDAINAGNKIETEFWDKRQLVKKINLNSLYGALLNPGCRFFDSRLGQSTTLTGRVITKHMGAKVNEIITGVYDHKGQAVIYGDTDSVYFSAYKSLEEDIKSGKLPWTKESVINLYDKIGDEVNSSFPDFAAKAFHTPKKKGEIIRAGREAVATKGIFITKKRYAILIYDLEGKRTDTESEGKVKAMGLDLKRSDTPVFIQNFLSDVLQKVLTGSTEEEVSDFIMDFRKEFKQKPGWLKGSPKRCNNLTEYVRKEERQGKANMPGHVRASMNWNRLLKMYSDKHSKPLVDGSKVVVCKLKANPLQYTSVAYPVDQLRLPEWFKELPFDNEAMEESIINAKLDNLIGVLNWNLVATQENNTFNTLFEF